ncbi:unnamed protein product [Closterium sp. NIES-64]|nr:unnamed protein product [Closterium sp. NIES-64]
MGTIWPQSQQGNAVRLGWLMPFVSASSLLASRRLSLLVPLCGATAAGSAGSAALWKSLLSDGLYPITAVEPSIQPLAPLLQSQTLLRGHPFRGSQKQVLAGSGNTMYQQEKNAGSINNQGSVNNQRSKVYRDGPGLGSASTVQSNQQTQTADTNPMFLPCVSRSSRVDALVGVLFLCPALAGTQP